MKTGLLDASSAIILCKAELHTVLADMYHIVMPKSVYNEITVDSLPGSLEYPELLFENKISLEDPVAFQSDLAPGVPGLIKLGRSEKDVIQLYLAGGGDFVVTDDGGAAKYCRREGVPFINALLIPMVLLFAGIKDADYCLKSYEKVKEFGRYGPQIISFAEECTRSELESFLP